MNGGKDMKHKIEIIYSKTPPETFFHDSSGTNILELRTDRNKEYSSDSTYTLTFEMQDTTVSKKFVNVWNSYNDDGKYTLHYNTYATLSTEEILQRQELMNEVITQINNYKYDDWSIPDELFLELNGEDAQVDKLNTLHRFFEDCSYYMMKEKQDPLTKERTNYLKNLLVLLEKVNYLVHRMEGGAGNSLKDYTVFRHANAKLRDTVKLTKRDYKLFTPCIAPTSNGVLYLDYCTVGKDLEACWRTKDLELIKAKEVKQQEYINTAFNFTFNTEPVPTNETHKHEKLRVNNLKNQWCEENDVGDYYNYWEPEYNVGRIILGECIDEDITDVIAYRNMLNHYPYIIDIIVK